VYIQYNSAHFFFTREYCF